jgi:baculoviral IAP repeat-containing protein 6
MDSTSIQSAANIIDDILIEAPSNTSVVKLGSSVIKVPNDKDAKKTDEDFSKLDIGIANNVKNILVDKIFYSHIKKHKLKDFEDKLLASVKSDEKSLSTLGMSMFGGVDDSNSDSGWGPGSGGMLIYGGGDTTRNSEDGSDEIFDSSKVASVASLSNKIKDFIEQTNKEDSSTILPWHKLLSAPTKHQMIVVDRMHSGARRQVTLDFGYPVLLTDVVRLIVIKSLIYFFK